MNNLEWTLQTHINGRDEHTLRYQSKHKGTYIFMDKVTRMKDYTCKTKFSSAKDDEVFDELENLIKHLEVE